MSSRATNADRGGYPVRSKGDNALQASRTLALYHSRARGPKPKTVLAEQKANISETPSRSLRRGAMMRRMRKAPAFVSLLVGAALLASAAVRAQSISAKDLLDGFANPARWLTYS